MVKKAFTLIELVVAIVVIGIAMMSIPLMLSQASKSNEFNINQEAILAGVTKISSILTYSWNETNSSGILQVFDVTNGDSELNRTVTDKNRRVGHFKEKYRRKFYDDTTEANLTLGHDKGNEYDDIDDFNGEYFNIVNGGTGDYIKDLNLSVTVSYIKDSATYSQSPTLNFDLNTSPVLPSTNIKIVEINVTDKDHNIITKLKAFSANIGSYELLYRVVP